MIRNNGAGLDSSSVEMVYSGVALNYQQKKWSYTMHKIINKNAFQ